MPVQTFVQILFSWSILQIVARSVRPQSDAAWPYQQCRPDSAGVVGTRLKSRRWLIVALILVCVGQLNAREDPSQPNFSYGVFGRIVSLSHDAAFNEFPGLPKPPAEFSEGDGTGLYLGALAVMPFNRLLGRGVLGDMLTLELRAGLLQYDALLETDEPTFFINQSGVRVPGVFRHSIDASFTELTLEPTLTFSPLFNLRFVLGPSLHFPLSASFTQTQAIAEPEDVTLLPGERSLTLYEGDVPDQLSPRSYVQFGLSYDFALNEDAAIVLSPELSQYTALSDLVDGIEWSASMLHFGLQLRYSPQQNKSIDYDTLRVRDTIDVELADLKEMRVRLRDTTVHTLKRESADRIVVTTSIREHYVRELPPPPPSDRLEAQIAVFAIAGDQKRESGVGDLKINEIVTIKYTPLLSYIFFDVNSDALDDRYRQLRSDETVHFDLQAVHQAGTLATYYHLLNIIGLRMRTNPATSITLTGCNANQDEELGNTALSRRRAESIRRYLSSVWAIDPDRLRIASRNLPDRPSNTRKAEGMEENRRVELSSSDFGLLKPVLTRDTVYHSEIATLRLRPEVVADAGIDGWRIAIEQGQSLVKEFLGRGSLPPVIEWELDEKSLAGMKTGSLRIMLAVTDVKGQQAISRPLNIPLNISTTEQQRARGDGVRELERYSLLLFDFDDVKLSGENREVISMIRNRLRPNATINIIGTTDRVGDEEYNRQLSLQRAQSAARALGVDGVVVTGIGEDKASYPNDLPEGRFYSRTVIIEVETEIE